MFERHERFGQFARLTCKLDCIREYDNFWVQIRFHQRGIVVHSLPRNGEQCRSALFLARIGVFE